MRLNLAHFIFCGIIPVFTCGQETFRVDFEQSAYSVLPNGEVTLRVLMTPPPANGLFSYGVRSQSGSGFSVSQINVAAALDYNGVNGPGAILLSEGGLFGAKGTVNVENGEVQPYAEALLATFVLRDLSGTAGNSEVFQLDFFRTLGETETLFVDGAGNDLDGLINFGSATVTVVPEPGSIVLFGIGLLGLHLSNPRRWPAPAAPG